MNTPIIDLCNGKQYADAVDLPMESQDLQNGQIYLANDARFSQATFNQPLTTYAVGGWAQPAVDRQIEALVGAPIQVGNRFNYKVWSNVEAFRSGNTEEDRRAIGAEYKAVNMTNTEVNAQTVDRGLIFPLDKRELQEGVFTEQMAIDHLITRLKINQLRRAHALLVAAATNTAKTWLTGFTKDPDMEVYTEVQAYHTATGIWPNTVTYGKQAKLGRFLQLRNQATAGAFAGASAMTMEQIATAVQVENAYDIDVSYQSSATAKTAIGNAIAMVHYAARTANKYDPSNIRYFWSPTVGGGRVEAFRYEVGSSQVVVGVRHCELIAIPFTGGIRTLTIS
jgi:hypothetical protein